MDTAFGWFLIDGDAARQVNPGASDGIPGILLSMWGAINGFATHPTFPNATRRVHSADAQVPQRARVAVVARHRLLQMLF
jgi:hypothetical protein